MEAEIEALVLAELAKRVKVRTNSTKALFGQQYANGDRQTFRSPIDDAKLGIVYRTDPDPEWRVTNRELLCQHLATNPANMETVSEIVGSDAQVIEVLVEHAPHLLAEVTRVSEEAISKAVLHASEHPAEAAPGIEKVKPEGSLTVRPDPAAGAAIERMVEAGVITWDGRPAIEQAA